MLGRTDEAKKYLLGNVDPRQIARGFRFPAMWTAHYDWMPDQDHGSGIMLTLQYMVMQYEGDKIILLPAWPKAWNAHFKLHAPKKTTVEGKIINGKVTDLKVTPASRLNDVLVRLGDEFVPYQLQP